MVVAYAYASPSVEVQCFHLRRLDLPILLRRCLAPVARDLIARTCRPVWVFPCCDDLSLGNFLWGICDVRHNLLLRASEWCLFGQKKRMDCAHGDGGCDAVSQYWNMMACNLGWNVKSWFVILGSLNNFIGIICQSCNVCQISTFLEI